MFNIYYFNFIIMIISVFNQKKKYGSVCCVVSEKEFHLLENRQIEEFQ